ncbi:MAG: hypothetical protein ACHQU1_02990, partial [Gemmatimonadales bacterium]
PYVDGLTMRRGSAMQLLANGIAVVSSTGELLDPECAKVAACESSSEAFARRVEQLALDTSKRAEYAARSAAARHLWSVDVLADAIVSDLT